MNEFILENKIENENENDNNVYMEIDGSYQVKVNGDTVDHVEVNAQYDGNELDLEATRNDEALYMNLNKNDILKLLEVPAYHKTISQRLEYDLNPNNNIDIRPIIIEQLKHSMANKRRQNNRGNHSHSNKSKRSSNTTKKNNGNEYRSTKKVGHTSKSRSKSKSKRRIISKPKDTQNSSRNKHPIVPDYLKTIY